MAGHIQNVPFSVEIVDRRIPYLVSDENADRLIRVIDGIDRGDSAGFVESLLKRPTVRKTSSRKRPYVVLAGEGPTLKLTDVDRLALLAHAHGLEPAHDLIGIRRAAVKLRKKVRQEARGAVD